MKTKTVITLLLALIVTFSASARKKSSGEASVKFTETSWNFGNIPENGGMVSHEFEFENQGDGNLIIKDATAQCGCTRPSYPTNPIAPGKKGKLKVTYNPKGRPGSFSKDVTVRVNGKPSKVVVKIKGAVIPSK